MRKRVCALIVEDDKVLLVAHDYPRGRLWHLPGGKIENLEINLEEALRRELWEELKLEIKVDQLALIGKEKLNNSNEVLQHVFFAQRLNTKKPMINRKETSGTEVKFVPITELDSLNLYPNIGREIVLITQSRPTETIYLDLVSPREWL